MASEPNKGQLSVTEHADGQIVLRLTLPKPSKRNAGCSRVSGGEGAEGALLSDAVKSEMTPRLRSGFGGLPKVTQFGKAAKYMVRNGCAVLEKTFGRQCSFMTITLPGSTLMAMETLSRWTASIVDCLNHWVRDHVTDSQWVYVWELQKRGALHLHAAIGSFDAEGRRYLEENCRAYVHQLFARISDESGADLFERADGGSWRSDEQVLRVECVPVRKSVKRYMAKYLSKTVAGEQAFCPARWWGMSKMVRAGLYAAMRCSVHRSSLWGQLKAALEEARLLLGRLEIPTVTWTSWFSPEEVTVSMYPGDDNSTPWHDLLSQVIRQSYVDDDYMPPLSVRADSRWLCAS